MQTGKAQSQTTLQKVLSLGNSSNWRQNAGKATVL